MVCARVGNIHSHDQQQDDDRVLGDVRVDEEEEEEEEEDEEEESSAGSSGWFLYDLLKSFVVAETAAEKTGAL
ncbi:hypothetical protein M0804_014429 [Polistes exclamans]|nr:hypothetical protein M0804_014431 [Polistes exclamans]KAI4475237.1 hypothetical protein M0804_014429 [Polistes exclamans]